MSTSAVYTYNLEKKISEYKNSINNKGIIIETGAGMPLYSYLANLPNTLSKLVLYAISPTDWNFTKETYLENNDYRAISYDTVKQIINNESHFIYSSDFTFVNSIQIGNDNETQTHGWIGYKYKDNEKYYHFTVPNNGNCNRKELIDIIQLICLDILLSKNAYTELTNGYIDIIKDNDNNDINPLNNILNAELSSYNYDDIYQVYTPQGNIRLNDFLRTCKNELVIYKGSFNPIHNQHYDMYKHMLNDDRTVCLMISIDNRDNSKKITYNDLMKRIILLNNLNITVIINKYGLFNDVTHLIQNHNDFKNKHLSFLVGDDTLKRFLDDEKGKSEYMLLNNIKFYTVKRLENILSSKHYNIQYLNIQNSLISSTEVRKAISDENIKLLEELYKEKDLLNNILLFYTNL